MSLTGTPLIVLAVLGTGAALAGTVLIWTRGRRLRFLLRTLGVLLTEALLLLSVGLVVNRSEQFYPTWAALLQTGRTTGTTYATTPGHLDRWLSAHDDLGQSVAFTWQPTGWTGWHLAAAPTIVTPTGYLQHPGWRYSVLLVIDNGESGWTPATEAAAARSAGRTAGAAVMVFARTTPATAVTALTAALPAALTRDLRVTGRRWALVADASDAGLAQQAVAVAAGRYPAIALVQSAARPGLPKPDPSLRASAMSPGSPTTRSRPNRPGGVVTTTPFSLPAGIAVAVVGGPVTRPLTAPSAATATPPTGPAAAIEPVQLAADATNGLETALAWACQQTPPPLAASAPPVAYVPIHRRPQHHPTRRSPAARPLVPGAAASGSSPAASRPGGDRVPGQPRR